MSTIRCYNATGQFTPYGVNNQGLYLLNVVKQRINEHKEQMEGEGLKAVYVKQTDIFPAVILTLKSDYICNELYWRTARECIRRCGAEYVSTLYENDDLFDIDEDYTRFI